MVKFSADAGERTVLKDMCAALAQTVPGGLHREYALTRITELLDSAPALRDALSYTMSKLADGTEVAIVPVAEDVRTGEAADFLNVSRPYVVKLLEEGRLPYTMVGKHRRIKFEHLLAFKQHRDSERQAAARRLMAAYTDDAETTAPDPVPVGASR